MLRSEGFISSEGVLALEYDAARVHWGEDWSVPTIDELRDLYRKCELTHTEKEGVCGYVVRGRGDYSSYSIFLPCAGYGELGSFSGLGVDFWYWSSSPSREADYSLFYRNNGPIFGKSGLERGLIGRYYGATIRPVSRTLLYPNGTVSFETIGGSSVNPISVRVGQKVGKLPTSKRVGHKFLGWVMANKGGATVTPETIVVGDMTIYARWTNNIPADARKKVQLWAGGPYWATTNLGADKPEENGYYFWWGDTVGYVRVDDKWIASDGSLSGFSFSDTPYLYARNRILESKGWITSEGILAPRYDAAQACWGGEWRLPTKQEFEDLDSKCEWNETTLNGVNGYLVRGYGDFAANSIFLPLAGVGEEKSYNAFASKGRYWSSVPFTDDNGKGCAYYLVFGSGGKRKVGDGWCEGSRKNGLSVRPVQGFSK